MDITVTAMTSEVEKPRKRGRPRKEDIVAKTPNKGKRPVGRPKGDAAIINEYKARMLASPKSKKVLESIFNAALDDEHKHQASAWKLVMDRILPVAAFEKDVAGSSGKSAIQINITGVGETKIVSSDDDNNVIDADYEEK